MTGSRFSGQAMIEILVASGVFFISLTSVIATLHGGRTLVTDTQQAVRAGDIAQEGLEAVRSIRDTDWDTLSDGTFGLSSSGGVWTFTGSSDTTQGYTRTITLTSRSANAKTVESEVTWEAPSTKQQRIKVSMVLTNWEVTQENNYLDGDWVHPQTLGTADLDSGTAASDIQVENGVVYLSSQASNSSKPDFSIVNVTNTSSPAMTSSVDLGVSNISAIAKGGNYVYGSISGATNEFIVIDVTNPSLPQNVKSMDFSNGRSKSIEVVGNRLYVGLEQITGENEFYVFDVSDPLDPTILGSFEINGIVSAIKIFNNRAYIATSVDAGELMVLDVSNPASISLLGQYNAPGTENGSAVFVKDEYNIYLGRESSSTNPEFSVLDAFNPASIALKGSHNMATRVNDLVVVNRLAFVITEEANAELRILDISNPASITLHGSMNFPQAATGIDYENNAVFVSVRSQSAMRVIGPS